MASLYEDLLQDLEEIVAIENGSIPMEEIPNMPAVTLTPKKENP